eukprot:15475558-Alexandrium_andersonii.AAC.1
MAGSPNGQGRAPSTEAHWGPRSSRGVRSPPMLLAQIMNLPTKLSGERAGGASRGGCTDLTSMLVRSKA